MIVLVNDNSTGNDQIIVASGIKTIAGPQGQDDRRRGRRRRPLPARCSGLQTAGLTPELTSTIVNLETGAAAAAFAAGQLDAVGAFAPFTTQALKRSGSKVLFTSKDFPGSIPDHLVVSRATGR